MMGSRSHRPVAVALAALLVIPVTLGIRSDSTVAGAVVGVVVVLVGGGWAGFIHRYCPRGIGDVQLETRIGRIGELVPIVAVRCGCDLIALGWSQQLAQGRAPVVRETLERSQLPVLLVPVELTRTLEGMLAAAAVTT